VKSHGHADSPEGGSPESGNAPSSLVEKVVDVYSVTEASTSMGTRSVTT